MVDNNDSDDLDTENEEKERKPITVSRLTIVLLAVVVALLVALSVTGTLLAVKLLEPQATPTTAVAGAMAVTNSEPNSSKAHSVASSFAQSSSLAVGAETGEPAEGGEGEAAKEPPLLSEPEVAEDDAEPKKPAIYYPIKPPIIVNFDARGRQRFLQAELALMTRDSDVISAIELHMSMIRNNLLLLIGSHVYEELQTAEGKELLRQQCLQEVQRLMQKEIGKPGIEQVLFTNFVMQ